MRWDRLAATDRNDVRYCDGCKAKVTYCTSVEQARAIADLGGCVSIDLIVRRRDGDLESRSVMGRMAAPLAAYGADSELRWREPPDEP